MSFNEQRLTIAHKLGCAVYAIAGGLVSAYFMVGAALGDCPTEADCISETSRAFMFFGPPILTLAGATLLTHYFMRDKD